MGDPWTGMPAASADYQRSSAHHTVSPFNGVDEQITDAIIILNRLPNAIERQARDESRWFARDAQRSQAWVRMHEPELMKRADTLAMFMGMGVDPKDDAELRELLQLFEVPEGIFDGIEVSLTGDPFQKGYEPKKKEPAGQGPARQEPARQEPARQEPARQEPARQESKIQAPGSKRKQPDSYEDEVMRPQYGSSFQHHLFQHDLERGQAAGPKRVRQDTSDDWEPSSSMSHLWPARPAVGSRFRPVELVEAGVQEYEYHIPSGLASGRPVHGSGPRLDGNFESDRLDYEPRARGDAAATRPASGFGSWQEDVINNGVPRYESQLQSGFADEELAPNPEHRQHDVFGNGMRPPFGSGPAGSWFRGDDYHEGGVPQYGYGYHAQYEFSSTGQALGFEPRQLVPSGNERNNLRLSGEMVGPKRRPQAPPKTPQQEMSGAAKVVPVKKAKGEPWEKKKIVEKCPVVVPNVQGFVELRCDKCHCNASANGFWKGIRGIQSHLRKIHKENANPAEIFARCSVRSVSAEEVKRIESGELVIGMLSHKTVKGSTQGEGATGRAQREGGDEREDGGEQVEEAEARPVRTRRITVRDNSKGKLKKTTW